MHFREDVAFFQAVRAALVTSTVEGERSKARNLFETILDELRKQGIEVMPVSNLGITAWYRGKRFLWMAPRKKWFVVNALSTKGGWTGGESFYSRKDWNRVYNSKIKKYMEYLDSNA